MLDASFIRPIAHRGFHSMREPGATPRRIENSASAFRAAIERGYGIECDLQPSRDGVAIVHHDETLRRLTARDERVDSLAAAELAAIPYRGSADRLITLGDLFEMTAGRVPLLVEIKSEWQPLPAAFLDDIATRAKAYSASTGGPIALMSFDPAVMVEMRHRAPNIPRGIVSGAYQPSPADDWWSEHLSPERQYRLAHLLESRDAAPDFISYHVPALPTPVTRYIREVQHLPLFCWTVRTADDRRTAQDYADAPTFEGYEA